MKTIFSLLIAVVAVLGNAVSVSAQNSTNDSPKAELSVAGKTYEGSLQGMLTLNLEFKSDNSGTLTMAMFGSKESRTITYEQKDSCIIVHGQNGDMTFTQNEDDYLITNLKGTVVKLACQTPTNNQDKLDDVTGHTFSGDLGNGILTLSFSGNGIVQVSTYINQQKQSEEWPYAQNGDTITLTEPMGRKITLSLNDRNELKGMFTIVNVTLSLVE